MDRQLTWNPLTRLKRTDLNRKFAILKPLLNWRSKLSLGNKLTIYKTIVLLVLTYGIEVWGCANPSKIIRNQRFQTIVFRSNLEAPWFVTSRSQYFLHNGLDEMQIPNVPFQMDYPASPSNSSSLFSSPSSPRRLNCQCPRNLL